MAQAARQLTARDLNTLDRQYEVITGRKRYRKIATFQAGLFLAAAMSILVAVILFYLSVQSEITNSVKRISSMESTLNELRLDNDENYSRITSGVDLDRIRTIAIQELGMQYAEEGQIITFNGEGSDYFRQTGALPEQE